MGHNMGSFFYDVETTALFINVSLEVLMSKYVESADKSDVAV